MGTPGQIERGYDVGTYERFVNRDFSRYNIFPAAYLARCNDLSMAYERTRSSGLPSSCFDNRW